MKQNDLQEIRDLIYQNKICFDNMYKELGKLASDNLVLYEDSDFSKVLIPLKQISRLSDELLEEIVHIYEKGIS